MLVDKWGCKFSMIFGGMAQSAALASYWFAAHLLSHHNTTVAVVVLSLLGILIFMSNSLVIGSLFKTIVVNCGAGTRGSAVGIAKGYLGLGAGTYSCLFDAVRNPGMSDLDFLLMAAILALACIVFPALTLLPSDNTTQQQVQQVVSSRHFLVVYIGLLVLALLVVGTSAMFLFQALPEDYSTIPVSDEPNLTRACSILLAWLGPIVLLLFLPTQSSSSTPGGTRSESETLSATTSTRSEDDDTSNDYTLSEMLHTVTAWLLCWTCTILVGSGTLLTNNMGQEVEAIYFPARAASGCLAMFSVSQSMSRVLCGTISEWAASILPRPFFLIVASAFGVVGHLLLAVATSRSTFVAGIVVAGMAFGMVWPLMVLIVGEVFGKSNHGSLYMFYDGFTSAVGTLLISNLLASYVYESHITTSQDEMTCYGKGCFQWTHVIVAGLCGSCLVTSVGVLIKTRYSYGRPTDQVMHRRMTDELYGSPYMSRKKRAALTDRRGNVS